MPDFEFAAARIMHAFAGYTLAALLDEPLEVFLELTALADRVLAHRALEYPLVTLSTPLRTNDRALDAVRKRRGPLFRSVPRAGRPEEPLPSTEKLRAALELAHRINNGQTTVSPLQEYPPRKTIHENRKK